jgi:membrane protease YdiL (CAAX protease family)
MNFSIHNPKEKSKMYFQTIALFILGSLALLIIEPHFNFDYWQKALVKVLIFIGAPLYLNIRFPMLNPFSSIGFTKIKMIKAILLGMIVYILVIVAFILIQPFLSFETIKSSLLDNVNVTKENFIFVALYISLINSWIEEFFFRGFGYFSVKPILGKMKTYILSSMLFAIYHIGIVGDWAHPILVVISIIGLFFVGIFFILLNERNENFVSSWMVHMFANLAINTIGLHMFGIIHLPFLA